MSKVALQFDLPVFVDGLKEFSVEQVILEIQREMLHIDGTFSRDSWIRFNQVRYSWSLNRLLGFLTDHSLPHDLTPKETSAFQELGRRIEKAPETLAMAFRQIAMPLAHAS